MKTKRKVMHTFECLYFLENFYLYIIEIKLTSLPKEAEKTDRFKWLMIDKETLEISQLTFRSMDSSDQIEERYFEEGFLKFNSTIGTYIEKYNSAQHPLDHRKDFKIPTPLVNAITDYLEVSIPNSSDN